MYKIIKKRFLNENTFEMVIEAKRVSKNCLPGQFIILKIDEEGERIPLTIADYDREKGTITIVVQVIGASTTKLSHLEEGEFIQDFVGPIGMPSELTKEKIEDLKNKKILFVGGGVGVAPVYPQAKWLHNNGVDCDVIIGARSKDIIIYEEEMKKVCKNLYITTDDGSYIRKGMVTNVIEDLYKEGKKYDLCIAIGPLIMMKFVCKLTKTLNLKTIVSMNPLMVDGTGMCGCCRINVGDEVKFACVDGPEFDGHKIDFDNVMKRAQIYKTEEGRAMLKLKEGKTHHGGCGVCGGEK